MRKSTITKAVLFGATLCGAAFMAPEAKADPMTHDGFYLQLNTGLGYLSSSAEVNGTEVASRSGLTIPTTILLGGTVGPVVIGGGLFWDFVPSPTYEEGGVEYSTDFDVSMTMIGIGMFADIYPDPKSGLHFQPFVGFGALDTCVDGNCNGNDPVGLVLALGAGYDFFVSDSWSIGPMLRFDYGALAYEFTGQDVTSPTTAFSALVTFTYH